MKALKHRFAAIPNWSAPANQNNVDYRAAVVNQRTNNNSLSINVESTLSIPIIMNLPDWNTYLAKACINKAGHVGGDDSDDSLFSRNVNSKP